MGDGPAEPGGQTIEALRRQLALVTAERDEAQAREAALADILALINATPGDPARAFAAMLDKAMVLCDAAFGGLVAVDGEVVRLIADRNTPPAFAEFWKNPQPAAHVLPRGDVLHLPDVRESDGYRKGLPVSVACVAAGIRTILIVPMVSGRGPIGLFAL